MLDLVLDTLVGSLAKKVSGETQEVGYKAFFNFLVIAICLVVKEVFGRVVMSVSG